jgi:hypothetical protein
VQPVRRTCLALRRGSSWIRLGSGAPASIGFTIRHGLDQILGIRRDVRAACTQLILAFADHEAAAYALGKGWVARSARTRLASSSPDGRPPSGSRAAPTGGRRARDLLLVYAIPLSVSRWGNPHEQGRNGRGWVRTGDLSRVKRRPAEAPISHLPLFKPLPDRSISCADPLQQGADRCVWSHEWSHGRASAFRRADRFSERSTHELRLHRRDARCHAKAELVTD